MRVKVTIRCKNCGEKFTLRGKQEKGRVETGFRQCLCDNREDFYMEGRINLSNKERVQ